ncbi:hypothetical protein POM88_035629 [Heracleum sosnowskyi]|uniref:F-box domain-containing protein n=2 Tax=Heracleum sosnowskyi TaxID=360622 RepID=A0AAD8HNP7_9APIA|nr:hypothetical protein POM88_035629 [Heracleum sosnowskyi]
MGVCVFLNSIQKLRKPDNPALNQQRGSMSIVQVFKRTRMDRSIVANDIPYLAEGLISEILSYSEVKPLLVCKSVCKQWYAIIKEDEFVDTHMTRNNGRFHVFKRKGHSLNSDGIKETYKYLTSLNGLLLVERRSSVTKRATHQIRNPSTKETLDIPYPNNIRGFLLAVTIYLDSSTGSYNLAYVFSGRTCNELLFLRTDLGRPGTYPRYRKYFSWRYFSIFNLNEHNKYDFRIITTQAGMLYVLKTLKVRRGKPEIICIDLIQGTDTTCIGPESRSHHRRGFILQLWKEKPTILSLVKDRLSVWVLEDYKKQKWSDEILISLTYLNEYPRLKKVTPLFLHADGEDMLIYKYPSVCYVYKLESKEFCEVDPSTGKTIEVAETLISLKGMRPEKKGCFTEIENAT